MNNEKKSRVGCQVEALESRVFLSAGIPRPDHVVVVVEENQSYGQILGPVFPPPSLWPYGPPSPLSQDPFIRKLGEYGASFTNSRAITHPSQPNYLDLFSGSDQGVTRDAVPTGQFSAPNLGGELIAAGYSFATYSEDLPKTGALVPQSGLYTRSHNPAADFSDVPPQSNLPFSMFPWDPNKLPKVSFIIPNREHDMHSGSIREADQWLQKYLKHYLAWAHAHNSLLLVTWDEGSGSEHIATIFSGQMNKRGTYNEPITHYRVLRTLEDMYGLAPTGHAADVAPITSIFK